MESNARPSEAWPSEAMQGYLACENELDRFDYLTELAFAAPGLPKEACTEENRIHGCDSRLWYALACEAGTIRLTVESDALLVKGLGVLLAEVTAALPLFRLAQDRIGLAVFLYQQGWVAEARRQGLAELEEKIQAFSVECQKTQS